MGSSKDKLLHFPCRFPVKAMGRADTDFVPRVVELVRQQVPDLDDKQVATSASRGGRYLSVTVTFTAVSQAQIDAVYRALHADEQVVMTL